MSFGSRRGFPYTDDDGVVYALSLDESNVEMVNSGAGILVPPVGARKLPEDINRRFIRLKSADMGTKVIPILTRARYDAIEIGDTFATPAIGDPNGAGVAFVVFQKVPERILRPVIGLDTGKIDGDQP